METGSIPELQVRRREPEAPDGDLGYQLEIPADVRCVKDAVELIASRCFGDTLPSGGRMLFRIRVLLTEAISNSILFGASGDPGRKVRIEALVNDRRIRLEVTDDGPGFDPSEVPDPTLPNRLGRPIGRGLFLIRSLADEVEFNERGNTIWMTLARSS